MSWGCGVGSIHKPASVLDKGENEHPNQDRSEVPEDDELALALETIGTNCQLIASQAEHLNRMRSRCHPTAQLAQQEIRNVEEKLLKLFSLQLVSKNRLPQGAVIPDDTKAHPSAQQWLEVVGLSKDAVEGICRHINSLESLLEKDESFLASLSIRYRIDTLQRNKMIRAVNNLKIYTENQMQGKSGNLPSRLYWDSWEFCGSTSRSHHGGLHRASVSSSEGEGGNGGTEGVGSSSATAAVNYAALGGGTSPRGSDTSIPSSPPMVLTFLPPPPSPGGSSSPSSCSSLAPPPGVSTFQDKHYTPPPTPPIMVKGKSSGDRKFPPTPPPCKKNMLQNAIKQAQLLQQQQDAQQPSLGRSTSHESRLALRVEQETPPGGETNHPHQQQLARRARLQSDSEVKSRPGGVAIYGGLQDGGSNTGSWGDVTEASKGYHMDTLEDEINMNKNTLSVPRVPRKINIPGSMAHNVHHRFTMTLKREICGYCKKKIPFSGGLKCKECNFKCHRDCKSKIAPSCGLPAGMLEFFITEKVKGLENSSKIQPLTIHDYHQLDSLSRGGISSSQPAINHFPSFQAHDSSSNTSSCNSSTPSSPALIVPPSPGRKIAFPFPDKPQIWEYESRRHGIPNVSIHNNNSIDSKLSHDSDKTLSTTSGSGSTGTDDSDRTIGGRVDSQDSTMSENDGNDSRCIRQNSVTSQSQREWDIPYDELEHGEVIGKGRFGTVYSGNWHGQIAIKELNMDLVNDEKTLEAFKAEVSTFRKTRHENLVLFMGACMKPPRFAIITSLVKGYTLYQHIHAMKEKFSMARTIPIARQIVQGMSYLHGKGIVHKDVKTKNIFLEINERVIVTDFGLLNVTRLCYNRRGHWLSIPHGWLCYLAPEIMRTLRLNPKQDDVLPFTSCSDVFAFGTVWYELLCGEWPHRDLPPEAVIWQVGRGMKPSLAHLQASRNVKDILMLCWSYRPEERPEFSSLLDDFHKLPKKRLDRSPSHPIQLSRSAESVF